MGGVGLVQDSRLINFLPAFTLIRYLVGMQQDTASTLLFLINDIILIFYITPFSFFVLKLFLF